MTFKDFIDKVFWGMFALIAHRIAEEVSHINGNIHTLNQKMAVVVDHIAAQDKRMNTLEDRVSYVEKYKRAK